MRDGRRTLETLGKRVKETTRLKTERETKASEKNIYVYVCRRRARERTSIHYGQIVVRSKSSMITFVSSVLLRLPAAHTNAESVHLIRHTTPRRKNDNRTSHACSSIFAFTSEKFTLTSTACRFEQDEITNEISRGQVPQFHASIIARTHNIIQYNLHPSHGRCMFISS